MAVDKQSIFDGLVQKVDQVSGKYLRMSSDIAGVLIYIAINEDLTFFFKRLVNGIDYQKEFNANLVYDQYGRQRLQLPKSKRTTAVILLGILKDIDCNGVDVVQLMLLLYPELKTDAAYENFCREYLPLFLDCVYELYIKKDREPTTPVTNTNTLDGKKLLASCTDTLNALMANIKNNRFLSEKKCEEYLQYCEAFKQALTISDAILISNTFRVMQTKLRSGHYRNEMNELAHTLRLFGIIN